MIRASDFKKGKDINAALRRLFWERDMLLDIVMHWRDYSPCMYLHNYIDWDDPEETKRTKKQYDNFCDKRKSIGQCHCDEFDVLCVTHWLDTAYGEEKPWFSDYTFGKVNSAEEVLWPDQSDKAKLDKWREINA